MSRFRKVKPPTPVNPFTGAPYGTPAAVFDEQASAAVAAGQLALTTANSTRDALMAEIAEHPDRFRSPLHPTPEALARSVTLRGRR